MKQGVLIEPESNTGHFIARYIDLWKAKYPDVHFDRTPKMTGVARRVCKALGVPRALALLEVFFTFPDKFSEENRHDLVAFECAITRLAVEHARRARVSMRSVSVPVRSFVAATAEREEQYRPPTPEERSKILGALRGAHMTMPREEPQESEESRRQRNLDFLAELREQEKKR